jgi:hypothetical protein
MRRHSFPQDGLTQSVMSEKDRNGETLMDGVSATFDVHLATGLLHKLAQDLVVVFDRCAHIAASVNERVGVRDR